MTFRRSGLVVTLLVIACVVSVTAVAVQSRPELQRGVSAPPGSHAKPVEAVGIYAADPGAYGDHAVAQFYAGVAAEEARIIAVEAARVEAVRVEAARLEAERVAAAARAAPAPPRVAAPAAAAVSPASSLYPCGGDLPPCWVAQRESKGDYRIWNGGCYNGPCPGAASWASGKWQFLPSTWGGFGGYYNAADAPPALQDERARQVWAGGRGCSAWTAC